MSSQMICIGKITSPHGIRGAVKVKSYCAEPTDLINYSPISSKDGKVTYKLKLQSVKDDILIVKISGVDSRNDAESMRGKELYINRQQLPETEDEEFYYEDLVGLKVLLDNSKKEFGVIKNVANHGADDIIEIKLPGGDKTEIFAFTKKTFPEINITQGYVTLIEPDVDIVQEEE